MGKRDHELDDAMDTSRLTINGDVSKKKRGGVTPMLIFVCFLNVFGSSMVHGYSTGVLNAPEDTIQVFFNDSYFNRFSKPMSQSLFNFLWAFTVSIYLIGGMVGIFTAGYFADKFGRRGALQFSHIFNFISAIFFGTARPAGYFELLIVGRLMVGLSAGMGSGVVPMYLTESAPKHIRGSLGVLHQLGVTIGILLSQILGLEELLGGDKLWPVLLMFSAVLGVVATIFLPFAPESPRHLLVKKKDTEKAKEALMSFRGADHDVKDDIEEMQEEQMQMEREPAWTMKQLLRAKRLRSVLIIICGLQVVQQFSGINVVFYYSTSIFKQAGIPNDYVRYATLGTGAINVLMTVVAVYLTERAGRRPLLLYGMIGMGISAGIITLALNLQTTVSWMSYISFVCTLTFVISFAVGLGPIPLFLGGELFKQGPRPAAMSFSGMLNWLANFIVGISFPSIQSALKAYSFLPFMVVMAISAVLTFKYVKETKNKTYEEIAQMYYGKACKEPEQSLYANDGVGMK